MEIEKIDKKLREMKEITASARARKIEQLIDSNIARSTRKRGSRSHGLAHANKRSLLSFYFQIKTDVHLVSLDFFVTR